MASYIDINPTPTESRQPNSDRLKDLYEILKDNGANVGTSGQFRDWMMKSEDNRRQVYEVFKDNGANVGEQFSDFDTWLYDMSGQPTYNTQTGQSGVRQQPTRKTRYDVAQEQYEQGRQQTNATPISHTAMGSVGGYGISPMGMPVRNTQGYPQANPQPQAPAKPMAPAPRAGQWSGAPMQQTPYAPTEDEGNKSFMPLEQGEDTKARYDAQRNAVGGQGGQVETMRSDIDSRLQEAYQRDLDNYGSELDKGGFWARMGRSMQAAEGNNPAANAVPSQLSDDTRDYQAAKHALDNSQKMIDEANAASRNGNFFAGAGRGMRDKFFDVSTWDFGITDLTDQAAIMRALDAYDKGEQLTESQQALLDAKALELATTAYFGSELGRGYKAGQVTAEAIPLMFEMAINPAAGVGKGASKAMVRYALKKFGKEAIEKGGKRYIVKQAMKYGTRIALDPVGAGGMAVTTGAARTAADALGRMAGNLHYGTDEQGNITFDGHTDAESWVKAFGKAFASTTIENYSEMLGNYFGPALGLLGKGASKVGKGIARTKAGAAVGRGIDKIGGVFENAYNSTLSKKIGLQAVGDFISKVPAGKVAGFLSELEKRAQWHGVMGEYTEEIAGGLLNALVVGDQTLDKDPDTGLFNWDNNVDTFLGVALMGGFFAGAKTVSYGVERAHNARQFNKANRMGASAFGDGWADVQAAIESDPKAGAVAVLADPNSTKEQREAALRYAAAVTARQGMEQGKAKRDAEGVQTQQEAAAEQSYNTGYDDATTDELRSDINMAYTDARQTLVGLIGEDAVNEIDSDPLAMQAQYDQDMTVDDNTKSAIADYVSAKSAWDGVQQRISNDAADRADQRRAEGERMAYKGKGDMQGAIRPLIINEESKEEVVNPQTGKKERKKKTVYLVNGNIAIEPNGSGLGREGTDKTIYVYDPETGDTHDLDPFGGAGVLEVGEPVSMEDYLADNEQQSQAEVQQAAETAQGKVKVNTPFETPQGRKGVVQSIEGDNAIVLFADGGMEQASMPLAEVQQYADALRRQEYEARHPQQTAAEQPQQPNTATVGQTPTATEETPTEGGNADTRTPAQRTYDDVVAKLGADRASKKIDATAKVKADRLTKAQKALKTAQETADNTEYGSKEEQKAEEAVVKAQAEYDAAQQDMAAWDEVRKLRDQALLAQAEQEEQQRKAERERRLAEETEAQRKQREEYEAEQARRKAEAEAAEKRRQEENERLRQQAANQQPAEQPAPIEGTKGQASQLAIARQELADDTEALAMLDETEPRTLVEVAATLLASGKNATKLLREDFKRETGYSDADVKRYPFLFAGADKGGITLARFGEMVIEAAREYGVQFDETDATSGIGAALELLGSIGSQADINDYITNSRIAEAYDYHNAALAAARASMLEAYGMTEDEYEAYMSWLEDAAEQRQNTLTDEQALELINQAIQQDNERQAETNTGNSEQQSTETTERTESAETDVSQNGERGNREADAGTAEVNPAYAPTEEEYAEIKAYLDEHPNASRAELQRALRLGYNKAEIGKQRWESERVTAQGATPAEQPKSGRTRRTFKKGEKKSVEQLFEEEKAKYVGKESEGNEYAEVLAMSETVADAVSEFNRRADAALKEADDWRNRTYKPNNAIVEGQNGADEYTTTIGAANERRRENNIKRLEDRARELQGYAETLKERTGYTPAAGQTETWEEHVNKAMEAYDKEYAAIEKSDGERLRKEAAGYSDERLLNTYIRNAGISQIFGKGREGMRKFIGEEKNFKAEKLDDVKENHLEAAPDAARQSFVQDVLRAELDRRGIEYKEDYTFAETSEAEDWYKKNVEGKTEQPRAAVGEKEEQSGNAEKVKNEAAPKQKIDDVGEKIGGARKDLAQKMGAKINLDADTFPKMFPKFDLKKAVEQGLDPKLASSVYFLRIAAQKEYKSWLKHSTKGKALSAAKFFAAYAKQFLENGNTSTEFKDNRWTFTEYGKKHIEYNLALYEKVYEKFGNALFDLDLTGYEIKPVEKNEWSHYYRKNEQGNEEEYQPAYEARSVYSSKYYVVGELDKAIDELVNRMAESVSYKESHPYKLSHYYTPGVANSHYIGVKLGGKVVALTEKMGDKETSKYLKEHEAELQEKAKRLDEERKQSKQGGTNTRWKPELGLGGGRARVGNDYRNGKDVSAEEFRETFGFRGVEFGNYVTQAERQRFINEAYDAMMDLAALLNVSPRALSLGGRLGFAIGARGGGNAVAHYEPDMNVINLTKSKGAGSLAHEWWHALDYYFNRMGDYRRTPATANKRAEDFNPGHRAEMANAFVSLMEKINGSDYRKRSVALDAALNKDYYTNPTELGARAFQDYVQRRLTDKGQVNDFLSSFTPEEQWNGKAETYPYPTGKDADAIDERFDNLFGTMLEREDEQGNVMLYERADGKAEKVSVKERKLRDAVVDLLRKAGIEVVTDSEEGQRVLDMANGRERQHRVYHGSGADFEAFDHSHMGEGEGAQAFGWGTYVTEVKGIGKSYAQKGARNQKVNNALIRGSLDFFWKGQPIDQTTVNPLQLAAGVVYDSRTIAEARNSVDKYIDYATVGGNAEMAEKWKETLDILKESKKSDFTNKPHKGDTVLYTVEIPEDNGSNYLDWSLTIPKRDRIRIANAVRGLEGEPAQSVKYANYTGGWGQLADMIERNQWAFQEVRDRLLDAFGGRIADDKKVSVLMHDAGFVGIKYPADYYNGGRADNAKNYVIFNESDLQITDKVKFFRTESGEAYGFTMGGKIYLDPKIATAETPIHEYTHLWAAALREANPKAWEKLKAELEKDTALMDYVQRLYPDLKGDDLLDEVFAHFSGRRGAERLRAEQERMEGETQSIVGKAKVIAMFENLRNALKRFWNAARELFAGKDVKNESAEDFADMVLADLVSGFNPSTDSDVRFRGEEEPVFYSNAMRAVENIKQERATPEQWVKMIEKQGGLKAGEDKWLGLSEWLKGSDAKTLTKGEVLDYIRANEIQIEEVEYGETDMKDGLETFLRDEGVPSEDIDGIMQSIEAHDGSYAIMDADLYNEYQSIVDKYVNRGRPINSTRLQYTTEGLDNKREIVLTVPTIEPWNEHDEVHFGEAGGGRAVAWVRFGETTDADGKRVLVIDEIQSNRHQEGREKGYKNPNAYTNATIGEFRDSKDEGEQEADIIGENGSILGYIVHVDGEGFYAINKDGTYMTNTRMTKTEALKALQGIDPYGSTIPDAPFEKNWHEVAMKRMLRFAAENGYDKVAWTKGEQQAERYDLSTQVKRIRIARHFDELTAEPIEGEYEVYLNDKYDVPIVESNGMTGVLSEERIKEVYGKDLGQRMIDAAKEKDDQFASFEGNDLRIGGEGMKGFYDQILPRFMDKYGKKWGVKTGEVELPSIGENGLTMWSVDVTDDMRESVMRGQPLFRNLEESDNVVNNADAGTRPLTDREKIAKLEREPKVKVYRSMQLIDGKLYPPMSARVDGQLREPSEIGVWEEAEEHPELADENGKFKLDKGNKKSLKAAYNPYIHTSRTMLNDQFSEAQSRPNLIVVEVEIPESELNGTYRAEKAKDSVGAKQWKAGVIQGQLSGTREVILSRWAKPVRIVPDAEVAENIARQIEGQVSVMPSNVVTPQVRAELEKRGVRFVETDNTGRLTSGNRKGETWAQVYGKNATKSREGGEEAYAGDWYDRGSVERIGEFAGYSPKQIAKMNARQEESARKQFNDTAEKLHLSDNITFADSIDDVPGLTDEERRDWRRKKGWYSPRTGKIVIILGNHKSMDDVMKSILHEGVAHHGLRQMFGEHFNTFLDNVYQNAHESIRDEINAMAKKHGWNFREATEEYLAKLAEDTDFEKPQNQSWWGQVKQWFFDMLHKIGFKLHDAYDTITDNELRYILWRSYQNLVHPGRYNSVVEEAKDIAKQYDLKVGQWDETWTAAEAEPNATIEYNGRKIPVWAGNGRRGNRTDRVEREDRVGSDYNVAADGVAEDAAEYAKRDAEYMEAVNSGDMEKAQRMVNEAARKAGYSIEAYHGTRNGAFTVFDNSKGESISAIPYKNLHVFTSSKNTADTYRMGTDGVTPKTGEKYGASTQTIQHISRANLSKATKKDLRTLTSDQLREKYGTIEEYGIVSPNGQWHYFPTEAEAQARLDEYANGEYSEEQVNMHVFLNLGNTYIFDAKGEGYRGAITELEKEKPNLASTWRDDVGNWRGKLNEDLGEYDSLVIKNVDDNGGGYKAEISDVYYVKSPNQIKSADPVTYDDNGNVIPLSQRFNEGSDDIRFRDGEDEETGAPKAQAREAYERMVSSAASQWKEAMQDSMLSLKKLYQAVSEATSGKSKKKGGYRIEDEKGYENAYLAENRMHSMSEAQIHAYQQDYMKPLQRAIHALTHGKREAYETLTDYMMAKHGLERNEVMAKRDAKKAWEEAHKDEQGNPNYEAVRDAAFADIDDGVDELYLKYRKKDYAGLTALTGIEDVEEAEKEAQRMVDEYEMLHDTTDLWTATNRATRRSLFKMLECGLLSPARHAEIRDMFQYYIPLQGFDSDVAEDVYAYMGSDGTAMYGTTIRKAKGRKSKADDPIATIAMNGEAAIRRGNRNLMKQHFLRFVQSHPSDLVSINDVWLRKNANGEWEQYFDADLKETDTPEEVARKVRDFNERMEQEAAANPDLYKRSRELPNVPFRVLNVRDMEQHQVMVQVDGKNYLLTINGNPRAAQALNGLTNPDVFTEGAFGSIMNASQSVVRTLSQFYTTRNPNFVLSNFLRDAVYTNSMVLAKESPNYALNFHKNFLLLPNERMGVLFASWENGKLREKLANGTASNMEKMFYDFMMNGGETGWTSLRDIEKHKRDLQKALKREGNIAASALKKLGDFFDITNRMIENHARFTAYVTSIEMGRSVERAVWDAKEISVNFNKKGAGDKFLKAKNQTFVGKVGAFVSGLGRGNYAFWNASLQGLNNIARIGKRNPAKFMAVATTLMGLGVAIPLLNALLGGDDDDDKNAYWNLPEYVRRSNICFRFTKDMPWITIPLPIEFRAIYGLGELGSGVALGKEYYSKGELTKQVAAQFSQVLPLDFMEGGGGWHCLYPTYIKPVIEAYSNQSWTGLPIYRKNTYGQYDVAPEWQRAYSNTNNQIMAATKWLNEATGGDEVQVGNIDFNPARIEYMLRGYLGGYFTVADQVIKMGETATGNREFEWRNMMLANRVVKEGDERTEARKLTNEYFNLKEEYDKTDKSLKAYKKKQDEGTLSVVGQAHYIALMNDSEEYGRYLVFGTYKPLFDAYYKQIKEANAAGDSEEAKRLERGQNELRREMVNIIHDMDNGGTFDRKKVATGINENLKKMQNDKLWDAQDKAINKSIEANNALNPTDNVEE